ncbi:hypothetical protein H8E88_03205 [candidate division KSB1 bacterium]|nr:hypothetical protein [candidate division KSB1 bacterium]MBL7093168.1 hypothetical protein [candidate division KSB1 bacterium]
MRRLKFLSKTMLSMLFFSFILFSACEKKEDIFIEEEPGKVTAEAPIPDEQPLEEQSEREKNLDKFLKLVLEKEKELKEKEKSLEGKLAELEEKQAELEELEFELKKAELKFKDFRLVTYLIFFVGLACLITGLIMIVFRGKSKQAAPEPEAKTETKTPKKEPSKSVPETKTPKKESSKQVTKSKKTKTEKKPKE